MQARGDEVAGGDGRLRVVGAVIVARGTEAEGRPEDGFVEGFTSPREGWVLLTRLGPGRRNAGLWEFPGGKVEAGEDAATALARELDEELGLGVEVGALVAVGETERIVLEGYRCALLTGRIGAVRKDHDAFAWVAPEALVSFAMPPADVPIAVALVRGAEADAGGPG